MQEGENMASVVRRSILKRFLIVAACVLSFSASVPWALAQHPAGRVTGGEVRVPPPPIYRPPPPAPIVQPQVFRPPISRPPISTVVPAAGVWGTVVFHPPRHPIRPFPPAFVIFTTPVFFGGPFVGSNSCGWATCDFLLPWSLGSSTSSYAIAPVDYVSTPSYEPPAYGEARSDLPELFLKDGTILNVIDYWRVDDQLHFKMIEADGAQPQEHDIPFDELDLQKTIDVNRQRGFRFMLRNEPVEQYLLHHPELTIQEEP
jgi:hypothetical protein